MFLCWFVWQTLPRGKIGTFPIFATGSMTPPAASFQRLQIVRWVRSPDVARWRMISATWQCIFLKWNLHILFLIYTYSTGRWWACLLQKGEFYWIIVCFNWPLSQIPANIFFRQCPPCPHHVLAWFRTGGGGAWSPCLRGEQVGSLSLSRYSYFC